MSKLSGSSYFLLFRSLNSVRHKQFTRLDCNPSLDPRIESHLGQTQSWPNQRISYPLIPIPEISKGDFCSRAVYILANYLLPFFGNEGHPRVSHACVRIVTFLAAHDLTVPVFGKVTAHVMEGEQQVVVWT